MTDSDKSTGVFDALGNVGKHGALAAKYGSKQAKWGLRVNPPEAISTVESAIKQTYTFYPDDTEPDLSASDAERLAYDQRQALFQLIDALELQEFEHLAVDPDVLESNDETRDSGYDS